MQYKIVDRGCTPRISGKDKGNIVYIEVDHWDDFDYKTLYKLTYFNINGIKTYLGELKIGKKDMSEGRVDIPNTFKELTEEYFSIGQSVEYYSKIKELGNNIRIRILTDLRDVAFKKQILKEVEMERVFLVSLIRSISWNAINNQFSRVANGGAILTNYKFGFSLPIHKSIEQETKIEFNVIANSSPPTNIHVLIGRNGVGKTFLLKSLIYGILGDKSCLDKLFTESKKPYFFDLVDNQRIENNNIELFSNIICIAYSAFDEFPKSIKYESKEIFSEDKKLEYISIGLNKDEGLFEDFYEGLEKCFSNSSRYDLWQDSLEILNYDVFFNNSGIDKLNNSIELNKDKKIIKNIFNRLSSGHKIVLLSITKLIQYVEEKSFILIDEPETHLHPPLLSAYIRTISNILIKQNALAFITTHSPIVLQETPSKCSWRMTRSGYNIRIDQLDMETFGTDINSLTREIFGFEVTESGFNKLIREDLKNEIGHKLKNYKKENKIDIFFEEYSYIYFVDKVICNFNGELGDEAKAILRIQSRKELELLSNIREDISYEEN